MEETVPTAPVPMYLGDSDFTSLRRRLNVHTIAFDPVDDSMLLITPARIYRADVAGGAFLIHLDEGIVVCPTR